MKNISLHHAVLLSGSTIETRRLFSDLVGQFEAAVHAHNRIERVRAVHGLRVEADAFALDGRRRSETSEALLACTGAECSFRIGHQ